MAQYLGVSKLLIFKMRTKKLTMKEGIEMREAIENQISINEQEEARTSLEAKYNSAKEAVEQDSL